MRMYLGEVREVGIKVINTQSKDFTIEAAEYEVIDKNGDRIDKGFPSINEHTIIMLFSAVEIGVYKVLFKYHIGHEILKAQVLVEVIK